MCLPMVFPDSCFVSLSALWPLQRCVDKASRKGCPWDAESGRARGAGEGPERISSLVPDGRAGGVPGFRPGVRAAFGTASSSLRDSPALAPSRSPPRRTAAPSGPERGPGHSRPQAGGLQWPRPVRRPGSSSPAASSHQSCSGCLPAPCKCGLRGVLARTLASPGRGAGGPGVSPNQPV